MKFPKSIAQNNMRRVKQLAAKSICRPLEPRSGVRDGLMDVSKPFQVPTAAAEEYRSERQSKTVASSSHGEKGEGH